MLNLKKAAQNFTSKLGLINSHRPLVLTISEERQVHEALLKLILTRVNSATSLLRWAKNEENKELNDAISQLYDVNLMYAQIQREHADLSNAFSITLKEILQIEAGLDALRKQIKDISEKKERLQKLNIKNSVHPELCKLADEEEELQSELDVKHVKGEIFKSSNLKKALLGVCDANLLLAKKTELIFNAAKKVIANIPEVPYNLKKQPNAPRKSEGSEELGIVDQLAKDLEIERPCEASKSIFHLDISHSKLKNSSQPQLKTPDSGRKIIFKKKILEKIGLERPLPTPPRKSIRKEDIHWGNELKDFVIVSNTRPPNEVPPPLPRPVYREKSKHVVKLSGCKSDYDSDDYVQPNDNSPEQSKKLYRSSSDPNLNQSSMGSDQYCEPWESYILWESEAAEYRDRSYTDSASLKHYEKPFENSPIYSHYERPFAEYSEPYESDFEMEGNQNNALNDTSNPRTDCADDANDRDEVYSLPYDTEERRFGVSLNNIVASERLPRNDEFDADCSEIYENAGLETKVESKSIVSKPDPSNHIILIEAKSVPAHLSRVNTLEKRNLKSDLKLRTSISVNDDKQKITSRQKQTPPTPKPRPKLKLPDGRQVGEKNQDVCSSQAANSCDSGSHMRDKPRPVKVIPNITQFNQSDSLNYANDLQIS